MHYIIYLILLCKNDTSTRPHVLFRDEINSVHLYKVSLTVVNLFIKKKIGSTKKLRSLNQKLKREIPLHSYRPKIRTKSKVKDCFKVDRKNTRKMALPLKQHFSLNCSSSSSCRISTFSPVNLIKFVKKASAGEEL